MPQVRAVTRPVVRHRRPAAPHGRICEGLVLAATAGGAEDGAVGRGRSVVVVAFEGCEPLDVVGPAEVFESAARLRPGAYEVRVAAPGGGPVTTSPSLRLVADPLHEVATPLDTLVVAGGRRARRAGPELVDEVARLAGGARRVASVCTGAFVLAAAGLLEGRRATTHWSAVGRLAAEHAGVQVEADPIYVRDGRVWTSAGVTTGIDLALALVAEDLGEELAAEIAKWLVMFVRRPGGQSQFSIALSTPPASSAPLRDLQGWLADHLTEDLSVAALAERAGMSPRHFARRFRDELGTTPAAHVEALRVEAAKRELASGRATLAVVARRCGFASPATLHRAFRRATGTTPERYRQHFTATGG